MGGDTKSDIERRQIYTTVRQGVVMVTYTTNPKPKKRETHGREEVRGRISYIAALHCSIQHAPPGATA